MARFQPRAALRGPARFSKARAPLRRPGGSAPTRHGLTPGTYTDLTGGPSALCKSSRMESFPNAAHPNLFPVNSRPHCEKVEEAAASDFVTKLGGSPGGTADRSPSRKRWENF